MDDELSDGQGTSKAVNSVDSSCEKLRNSINRSVSETVIVIRSGEEGGASVSGENGDKNRNGNSNASKDDMPSCTIGVKSVGGNESLGGERVCRICHLSSDPSSSSSSSKTPTRTSSRTTTETTATDIATTSAATDGLNLIELGCGCKDELGIVHAHCAEAWFKLKGDRQCEICGEMAKNVTGIGDNKFMEKWNEMRSTGTGIGGGGDANLSSRGGGGIRRFCSFLLICFTIAFTWSWAFRNY